MAQFTVDIPDELLPALAAEFLLTQGSTPATTPEEYFAASVVEIVRQRAEIYKVGPYYVGPVNPQFRADGKPYGYVDPVEPEELIVDPDAEVQDAPVVEPEPEEELIIDPDAPAEEEEVV
jgi:hypothetical protein